MTLRVTSPLESCARDHFPEYRIGAVGGGVRLRRKSGSREQGPALTTSMGFIGRPARLLTHVRRLGWTNHWIS